MITPVELEALWARLNLTGGAQRQFRSVRVPNTGTPAVHAAERIADGARALLFDIPEGAAPDAGFETGGLRLVRVAVEDGQSMALLLEDSARRDLFTAIGADLISSATIQGDRLSSILSRLEAWRSFLRRVDGGLSRIELIGLVGELHVLERVLSIDPGLLSAWTAPADGLHDFERRGHALEVKATLGPGWRATITSLDQLDTVGLDRLDLIHIRLFENVQGSTLVEQIQRIEALLPDAHAARELSNLLLKRGLAPDDQCALNGLRISLEQLHGWTVAPGFPRLDRGALPVAVVEASYQIDLRSLDAFSMPEEHIFEPFGRRMQ